MARIPANIHDSYLCSILNDREIAAEYFRAVLPAHLVEKLDFSTLQLLPGSYISEGLEQTMSDTVYSCGFASAPAQTLEIALLVEHKSYYDKYVMLQIGSYLFSGYRQQVEQRKGGPSPIIPILFYHGRKKWKYRTLEDLFDRPYAALFGYIPSFSYVYNNLRDAPDGELLAIQHGVLSASLLLLKHAFDPEWIQGNFKLLVSIGLSQGKDSHHHRSMLLYAFGRTEFAKEQIKEVIREIPTDIQEVIMSTYELLIEEGRKEERAKAEKEQKELLAKAEKLLADERAKAEAKSYEVVSNLILANRFTTAEIANFATVTEEFVEKVRADLAKKKK
ncbi:Rpn family recombination-promoting nuclease/putative transposase [Olivibacter sitiensis]|uniref:Rpn family recombination-promoting nuclease/putative transposase n=1 Tax=Olivibacter sitiensis TaxID=376470 RepID=UPI000425A275|nr:Rpn family recombination-promoting nuclease/putative transposase [Olivibacter sitiensis]